MTQIKAGQEVVITVKGRVNTVYGQRYDLDQVDCISIELENGNNISLEADGYLSELEIEVIPEPLQDGLYYDPQDSADRFDQMSLVYKREGGVWYDNRLDETKLTPEDEAKLVRLGPVQE